MDILELRDLCLALPATEETTPFDETTLVYKVNGKIFALMDTVDSDWVSLKCDPEQATKLRETYDDVTYAPHMSKKHWVMLRLSGDLPADFIKNMVKDSYILVIQGMPKPKRDALTRLLIDFETSEDRK